MPSPKPLRRILKDIKADMYYAMKEALGSGFTVEYYESFASDFVGIAEQAVRLAWSQAFAASRRRQQRLTRAALPKWKAPKR